MSVVCYQEIVTPCKGEGWNEFPVVSVSFLDDGVFLFSVTIARRKRGDTITPLFSVDVYL